MVETVFGRTRLLAVAMCLGLGPANAETLSDEAQIAFRDWSITEIMVPYHAYAADTASSLAAAVAAYCEGEMVEIIPAFDTALEAYQGVQWVTFGPAFLFDRRFRLNLWPDDSNAVSRQLGGALSDQLPELTSVEGVASGNVALQGYSALERLLYPELPEPGDYACDLAAAVAGNIATLTEETEADWNRADQMPQIGIDSYLQTVITNLAGTLDAVATRKIMAVLGAAPEDARPRRAENWRSGSSLSNIGANIAAVRAILVGGEASGFDWILMEAGAETISQELTVRMEAVSTGFETVLAHEGAEGLTDPSIRDDILVLAASLEELRFLLRDEVAPALGVIVGFNSLDGD